MVTRDGVVAVGHDPVLSGDIARGPDGAWVGADGVVVRSLTFAELQKYDVGRLQPGTAYAAKYPDQVPVDGERMPRLTDVFALAGKAGNRAVRFNIEIKTDVKKPYVTLAPTPFADLVVKVVRESGMASRTTIQSFDWRSLRRVQEVAPEMPTAYLTIQQPGDDTIQAEEAGTKPWLAGFDVDRFRGSVPRAVKAAGGAIWSPHYRDLTKASLAEAHHLGLVVVAWTVNTPEEMTQVIGLGVDGIISDRPDLLRALMVKRGLTVPAATPVVP